MRPARLSPLTLTALVRAAAVGGAVAVMALAFSLELRHALLLGSVAGLTALALRLAEARRTGR